LTARTMVYSFMSLRLPGSPGTRARTRRRATSSRRSPPRYNRGVPPRRPGGARAPASSPRGASGAAKPARQASWSLWPEERRRNPPLRKFTYGENEAVRPPLGKYPNSWSHSTLPAAPPRLAHLASGSSEQASSRDSADRRVTDRSIPAQTAPMAPDRRTDPRQSRSAPFTVASTWIHRHKPGRERRLAPRPPASSLRPESK
jgi:hypothetical protein